MIEALKDFWGNYANFKDRSSRKNFWFAQLGVFVVDIIIALLTGKLFGNNIAIIVQVIYGLLLLIPICAMQVRRLHDINKSGWWMLLVFVPIGDIILLIFYCLPSVNEGNRY